MGSAYHENKLTFVTCIELVLMKRDNIKYNLVVAKLQSMYDCGIFECLEHPEYLRTVLKEVYKEKYDSILDEISLETDRLDDMDEFKSTFFKSMVEMADFNAGKIESTLITFAIEHSLLEISTKVYEEVGLRLYKKHNCYFKDCFEHPQYLKEILDEIFGNGSTAIIESIKSKLMDSRDKKIIGNFLIQIR